MKHTIIPISTLILLITAVSAPAGEEQSATRSPYGRWRNGPPADASYFPIAVWLQDPKNASRYKEAGINLYVALWRGPTDEQLAQLKDAGMQVIAQQNRAGLNHKDDQTIVGWMHGDEPDNAQEIRDPVTKKSKGYGPPVPPPRIVADYERYRSLDPTRPIMLNLGQGVANDRWKGRGPGAKLDDYVTYVKGGDVISYDVYPVADVENQEGTIIIADQPGSDASLWLVAKGLDRLTKWSEGQRILWNCIECTHIHNEKSKATPHQVRAEVWMSLVHGSMGLIYFVHEWKPKFNEHALLDDAEMLAAVTAINKQIRELAPVLNSPTLADGVSVESSVSGVPIDAMAKRLDGVTYVFSVAMRNASARGTFRVRNLPAEATVEVMGEGRSLRANNGRFEDEFGAHDVRLYKIR